MKGLTKIALFFFVEIISAYESLKYNKYGSDYYTFNACNDQISKSATFCTVPDIGCYCNNSAAMATLAGCIRYKDRDTVSMRKYLIHMCQNQYNITITANSLEDAYYNYQNSAIISKGIKSFNSSTLLQYPTLLDRPTMDIYDTAYINFFGNFDKSLYFGIGLLGFWFSIMFFAMIANLTSFLFPGFVKKCTGPISTVWRKWVTLPATSKKHKSEHHSFGGILWLIPSRFESIVLICFLTLVVFSCSYKINYVEGDPLFDSKTQALLRYIGDRTGIVSTLLIPLLILFAGRNNFLQWLTGWNFATFITYHRWLGRVVFSLVVIHAICFAFTFGKNYKKRMEAGCAIWGSIATIAGGLIMVQGLLYFRRNWYEMFLAIHILLAVLFVAGSWVHAAGFGYQMFFYVAVAVWGFDRAIRFARLAFFGFPSAQVSLLSNETLKIIIPKPSYWRAIPGGHAFIHFLRPSCFWQSHPFTFTQHPEFKDKIILFCRVKGGVTHGLYQYLMTHPSKSTSIRVAIEGPYGEPTPARNYDLGVFIAGGNGIPGIYSEICDLVERDVRQTLSLFWVVQDYKSLLWFYEELFALKGTKVSTTIFLTRPDNEAVLDDFEKRFSSPLTRSEVQMQLEEKYGKTDSIVETCQSLAGSTISNTRNAEIRRKDIATIKQELSHVNFVESRPSMEELVAHESEESVGSTAFVVCGHPAMVDDLRLAVYNNLEKSKKRIDYFEQLQVWA